MMDFLDEVAEHRFGNLKVRDHAIFHWPDGHDVSGGSSKHTLGFLADRQNIGSAGLNRNNRWLS
jgi:hypothetical protein